MTPSLAARRADLDRLRPLAPAALRSLEHLHDLERSWTSNAIEGNTLTAAETQLVVEKGITIGGWPPVAERPVDRPAYVAALQRHQAGGGTADVDALLPRRLEETLDEILAALRQAVPDP